MKRSHQALDAQDTLYLLPDDVLRHVFTYCSIHVPIVMTSISKSWQEKLIKIVEPTLVAWVNGVKGELKSPITDMDYKILGVMGDANNAHAIITRLLKSGYEPMCLACYLFKFMRPSKLTPPPLTFYKTFMRRGVIDDKITSNWCRNGHHTAKLSHFYLIRYHSSHITEVLTIEKYGKLLQTKSGGCVNESTKLSETTFNGHEIKFNAPITLDDCFSTDRLYYSYNNYIVTSDRVFTVYEGDPLEIGFYGKMIIPSIMLYSELDIQTLVYYLNIVQNLKKTKEADVLYMIQYLIQLHSEFLHHSS